ncbi:MAG: phytoene desaturase family protein, partial [Pseudohongiellaceae bacterium]
MPRPQAVVVGAGIGGLVAALELPRCGVDVTVVERAERPGGKLREVNVNGHSIDAGPTVFTLRSVFEDIFRAAGSSLADQLTLTPLETLARHTWSDRERLDLHADLERSMDAIGEFSGAAEAQRYRRFCERAKGVFDTLEQTFIQAS